MKKLILLLLFIPLVSFGQTFKEIEKFHDNGNTAIETIKNIFFISKNLGQLSYKIIDIIGHSIGV